MTIHGLSESLYPTNPAHFNIETLIRPNILALHPYRCARDDYSEGILLDANENSLGHSIHLNKTAKTELEEIEGLDLHRYPSPSHGPIKSRIADIRNLPGPEYVFLGVGSDEVIDLLIRIIVKPGGDEKILITPPTYGMYSVCAQINDVGVVKVPLELEPTHGEGGVNGRFSLRVDKVQ
jgi:histidinol-phosphate aminotransferase